MLPTCLHFSRPTCIDTNTLERAWNKPAHDWASNQTKQSQSVSRVLYFAATSAHHHLTPPPVPKSARRPVPGLTVGPRSALTFVPVSTNFKKSSNMASIFLFFFWKEAYRLILTLTALDNRSRLTSGLWGLGNFHGHRSTRVCRSKLRAPRPVRKLLRQVGTSTCDDADETRIFKNKGRVGHDSTHLKKGGLKISGASGSVLGRKMRRFSQRRLGSELASN